jgi:hypothetical protein
MELLRVQGPKNNIQAVGDYLRADKPFEGENDTFDPVSSSKERYGVQLNAEKVFYVNFTSATRDNNHGPPPKILVLSQ